MTAEFFIRSLENYTKAEITITLPNGDKWSGIMKAPYSRKHHFWDRSADSVRKKVRTWAEKLDAPSKFTEYMKQQEGVKHDD